MTDRDLLNRVYSTISSLRQNIPATVFVSQPYVDIYHKALGQLEAAGMDIADFRIPAQELCRRAISYNSLEGTTEYGRVPEVERSLFLVQLDAVLCYVKLFDKDLP